MSNNVDKNDRNRAGQLLAAFAGAAGAGALMGYSTDFAQNPAMSAMVGGVITSGLTVCAAAFTKLTQEIIRDYKSGKSTVDNDNIEPN